MGVYSNPISTAGLQAVRTNSTQSASFTAVANVNYLVSAGTTNVTVTLPTSVAGQSLLIKKTDSSANLVTLSGTINGASTTLPLSRQNQAKELYADGSGGWNVILGDVDIVSLSASSSNVGLVQLSGDLGGTPSSPTTPTAVHLTGAETITGVKTFSVSPTIPAPTNTTDAVNKSYIDSAISSVTSSVVSQSQLTSYSVDPSSIGATISGTNGITVSESGNNITIGYSGSGSSGGGLAASGTSKITVGTTAPSSPSTGDLWVDTN